MERPKKIEDLVETIDKAIASAERLGLTFAVRILDMARLEVEQAEQNNVVIMSTAKLFCKRS